MLTTTTTTTTNTIFHQHMMASDQEDATKHQVEVELVESQRQNGSSNMKQDPTTPGAERHDFQQADPLNQHHNQKSQSFCAGCSGLIRDKFIFSVIDLYWHQDCVKCTDCMQSLSERCYTYEGKLYCRQDYWHRFGPKCYACQESIDQSELVQRIKGNRVYHLKCFTCNECHRQLEQGEQLHLIDDKKLICRQDFQRINHTTRNSVASNGCTTTASIKNGFSGQETQGSYFTLLGSSSSTLKSSIESLKHRSSLTSLDNIHDLNKNEDGDMALAPDDLGLDSADERENNNHPDGDEENRLAGMDLVENPRDPMTADDATLSLATNTKLSTTTTTKQSQANAIKRKRRRKQRLMASGCGEDKQSAGKLQGEVKDNKTTCRLLAAVAANRSGESILNGGPGGATTILAQEKLASHQLHHDQQVSCSSSSSSSTTSTSSSHSTSSNSTSSQRQQGGGSSSVVHHPNHHSNNNNHHHQQQNHHHLHHHHHHHHNQSSAGSGGGGGNGANEGSGGGGGHKPTRVRTVLNEKQLQTLRDCYANNPRPDALMKEQLVDMTGLSSRVIRVWFQNKRCKDKKKSILYKQMQQHEKDGRHLAGLTHIRGVPMVAASPIHYQDEHSSATATPPPPPAPVGATTGANPNELDQSAVNSVQSPQLIQQQQANAAVDNTQASHQAIDIHAYQPPWKGLADYAQQQQQGNTTDPASPRYQQLIGQIHGYAPNEHQVAAPEAQQQYSIAVPPPRPPTSASGEPGPYPAQSHPGLMQPPLPAHHHNHNHHHQQHHHHHLGQPALMAAAPAMDSGGLHIHQFQH